MSKSQRWGLQENPDETCILMSKSILGKDAPNTLIQNYVSARYGKDMSETPKLVSNVKVVRNMGCPKSRETHGHGVVIVVRDWESQLQGEGRQVNQISRKERRA